MVAISVAEGVALLVLGLLVVGLLRSHADILRILHDLQAEPAHPHGPVDVQIEGARSGAVSAADISGETLDGDAAAFGVVGVEHNTLLAFLSSSCASCAPFWQAFTRPVDVPGGGRLIVVVQAGDNKAALHRLAGPHLAVVVSDRAWESYDIPGSPHFVFIRGVSGSVLGEGTAASWAQVRDLMEHALSGAQQLDDPRDNAARIDRELSTAGIGPGHPSLYPQAESGTEL